MFADDVPQRTYRQSSQSSRGRFINYQRQRGSSTGCMSSMPCGNCGGNHQFGRQFCRAYNVQCYNCHKFGHIARCCRGVRRGTGGVSNWGPPPRRAIEWKPWAGVSPIQGGGNPLQNA